MQMETLRKHRNGGKQTVTVQHVNVSDGGKAIVGDVSHGGRVTEPPPTKVEGFSVFERLRRNAKLFSD